MGKPEPGNILEQLERSRQEGGLWQSDRDFRAQDRWTVEGCNKRGAAIQYLPSVTVRRAQGDDPLSTGQGIDPLYGDILDPQFIEDLKRENMRAWVEHKPSEQKLKMYSISEEKDVIFHIPFTTLKKAGLVTKRRFRGADIGDLVVWDGTWYIARAVHRGSYFGQRISHFFTAVFCDRYILNSVAIEDVADDCPEEESTGLAGD